MCIFNWPRIIEIMISIDFFHFYFLNSDFSVTIYVMRLKFFECDRKILLEESVSQIFLFRLQSIFYTPKRVTFFYFFQYQFLHLMK